MITFSFDPESHAGRCEAFVNKNSAILWQLYPQKWVVVKDCKVLFTADSDDEMFERAEALGMKRGTYYYRHFPERPKVVHCHTSAGI